MIEPTVERPIGRAGRSPLIAVVALSGAIAVVAVALFLFMRGRGPVVPGPGSAQYQEMVSAFFSGTVALEAGDLERARSRLEQATQLVPGEPAAWANLAVLYLQLASPDLQPRAAEALARAAELAPQDPRIATLRGIVAARAGQFDEAIEHLRRAASADPDNVRARVALAAELERRGDPASLADARRQIEDALAKRPANLALLMEKIRLGAAAGDAQAVRDAVAGLDARSGTWPPQVGERFNAVRVLTSAEPVDFKALATPVVFLRNVLGSAPSFTDDLIAVRTPPERIGEPIETFVRLAAPPPGAAAADAAMTFAEESASPSTSPSGQATEAATPNPIVVPFWPRGEGSPVLLACAADAVRLPAAAGQSPMSLARPGGAAVGERIAPESVVVVDHNNDFRADLLVCGAGGVALFEQATDGTFADVSAKAFAATPEAVQPIWGGWATDIEADGDADLVLSPAQGSPFVLRNGGDGTFATVRPFDFVRDVRSAAWADLDGDGDLDATMLTPRGISACINQRSGRFHVSSIVLPEAFKRVIALGAADINLNGRVDLLVLTADGTLFRALQKGETPYEYTFDPIADFSAATTEAIHAPLRLFATDLDNNGAPDVVVSGQDNTGVWLGGTDGTLELLSPRIAGAIYAAADLNADGRLDLVGAAADGAPRRLINRGTKDYHWQLLRPRAKEAAGDQRINSFGIGGEIELRAGLLYGKQLIGPYPAHFGLGQYPHADYVRIIWPNGTVQGEFDLKPDQLVVAEQRLKGSCPFLFAWDGQQMRFVKDLIWRSPLGLRINAVDTASVMQTEDWVKVPGEALRPRDGLYDLRVTADLWETHFFDHVSLIVVDHPPGTEVYVDERFARVQPELKVHTVSPPRPLAMALDDRGQDVSATVAAVDGRHLGTFGKGKYQGVSRDHWVELSLPADVPSDKPLVLLGTGWIYPTDSSINMALAQGAHDLPRGLSLEVPDDGAGWRVVRDDLGFVAGKNKTVLIPLDDLWKPGQDRKLRLRTNLEIYWDCLAVAERLPGEGTRQKRLAPESASLGYRGFSLVDRVDATSPELPHYDRLVESGPRWRNLIGYYTRYGPVEELLAGVDDRYVIMNAGDEMRLTFREQPPAPENEWKRDYVVVADGWVKDGDYNTAFSRDVMPLPRHDWPAYDTTYARLKDDPAYQRNPQDWATYHTRYVRPDGFRDALLPGHVRRAHK